MSNQSEYVPKESLIDERVYNYKLPVNPYQGLDHEEMMQADSIESIRDSSKIDTQKHFRDEEIVMY